MANVRTPLASIPKTWDRPMRRGATAAALVVSATLHGALAATFLVMHEAPVPYPVAAAIVVDLVPGVEVFGPAPGSTTGAIDTADIGNNGNDGGMPGIDEPIETAETTPTPPPAETEPMDIDQWPDTVAEFDTPILIEPTAAEPIEQIEQIEPVPTEIAEVSPDAPIAVLTSPTGDPEPVAEQTPVVFEAPPPRPTQEPPIQLAALSPPRRPEIVEPTPQKTTTEPPSREITPIEKANELSPGMTEATTDTDKTKQSESDAEKTTELAALPAGGKAGAPGDPGGEAGGGSTDGLFVGPGFRLGTAQNPLPRYPSIARRRGIEGRVVLRVQVDAEGHPAQVVVLASSSHEVLDKAALRALRKWRFEPAKRAGIAIAGQVDVPVSFRLRD
jgi:periplasmic protein TonB